MTEQEIQAIRDAALKSVEESKSPGAVVYVGDLETTYLFEAIGKRALKPREEPATKDTIYDLASLTKVLATTTSIMLLHEEGKIDLDAPASHYVPIPSFGQFTIRHCLTHTSGLVALMPFYKECDAVDEMLQKYAGEPLKWPAGTRWTYSDAGFLLLGRAVELTARDSLATFARKRIFTPLGMKDTMYKPPKELAARCAPTEQCVWRKRMMRGAVHDENAYAIGGVAGHAGLFSTAEDIAKFVRALLSGKIVKPETLEAMIRLGQTPVWPWQGLGWQLDPWTTKNWGFLASRTAFGHTGWTGTSLWIDAKTGMFTIQLANTCHPTRAKRDNETLRKVYFTRVSRALYPNTTNTHTGLDRLVRDDFDPFRGKRIGLLTHHAAVDTLGRHILDVFKLAPDVTIQTLFSPEHGLRGIAEAGEKVKSEHGAIPLVSLYGDKTAPSREELKGLDYFVVDLQDVGARYYTYAATMKACMRACADADVTVMVLDRPNPVGGNVLEGPIAVNTDSQVCWGQVPIRHGMTLGETAMYFQKYELGGKPSLDIKLLDAWEPARYFDECALNWIAPSPNIPSPNAALLYVGMCLFEGTNLNEGRGTDTPFEVVGAPWLDAKEIIASLTESDVPGCALEAIEYTPRSIAGKASSPRFQDELCRGIRVRVTDRALARPFTVAVALLSAIHRKHGWRFKWGRNFDVLVGSNDLRTRIEQGASAVDIVNVYAEPLAAFDALRPKSYLPDGTA